MLVLSRRVGERIQIGDQITLVVQRISRSRITLGIEAPDDMKIIRGELAAILAEFEEPREAPREQELEVTASS